MFIDRKLGLVGKAGLGLDVGRIERCERRGVIFNLQKIHVWILLDQTVSLPIEFQKQARELPKTTIE